MTPLCRRASRSLLLAVLAPVALAAACAAPLPRYPPTDPAHALALIAERHEHIRTIQSAATVDLSTPDRGTIRLDAALVAQPPAALRIRAWKLGRAVFDATIIDDDIWLFQPEEDPPGATSRPGADIARGLKMLLAVLGPEFYRGAHPIADTRPDTLIVEGDVDGRALRCTIERDTLTPRVFRSADADPDASRLDLDRYRLVADTPWPTRITIDSPDGRIVIALRDIELNAELPPAALSPPRRAVKNP